MLDREFLARNRIDFSYLFGRFMVEHLARLHRVFDGDLTLALVLGTIGQYNSRQFFEQVAPKSTDSAQTLIARGEQLPHLRSCNAMSVSASTGIPRETVRRKIRWLVAHGFVEQVAPDKLFITRKAAQHFAEFDLETMERFRILIREVEALAARRRSHEGAGQPLAGTSTVPEDGGRREAPPHDGGDTRKKRPRRFRDGA
ncbi:MAG TPA: hypothetical protein VLT59_17600 [Steroidobacteraceae bacterium]|nr:hypothetical protein [Steroidobacteraceae bacterium]